MLVLEVLGYFDSLVVGSAIMESQSVCGPRALAQPNSRFNVFRRSSIKWFFSRTGEFGVGEKFEWVKVPGMLLHFSEAAAGSPGGSRWMPRWMIAVRSTCQTSAVK